MKLPPNQVAGIRKSRRKRVLVCHIAFIGRVPGIYCAGSSDKEMDLDCDLRDSRTLQCEIESLNSTLFAALRFSWLYFTTKALSSQHYILRAYLQTAGWGSTSSLFCLDS